PFLAAARSRAQRAIDAWAALEADLARGLLDQLAPLRGGGLTPAEKPPSEDLQGRLSPPDAPPLALPRPRPPTQAHAADLERLLAQRQHLDQALAELAVRVSQREIAPLAQLQAALPADAAFLAWVDVAARGIQEHWGCVVRSQGPPHWERLPGSGPTS